MIAGEWFKFKFCGIVSDAEEPALKNIGAADPTKLRLEGQPIKRTAISIDKLQPHLGNVNMISVS